MTVLDFVPFAKVPRMRRDCVITEKLDGTNAQVFVATSLELQLAPQREIEKFVRVGDLYLRAGSRNRWLSVDNDNFGFARFVQENAEELAQLGPGRHFGEWWGSGIQRAYGLKNGDKRFSLFNAGRWTDENKPACCSVVPVLYQGTFTTDAVDTVLEELRASGSIAAPGFTRPEGVIVYHAASKQTFKVLLEKDELPKTLAEAA